MYRHGGVAALDDDDVLDRRRPFERLVGDLLERHDLAAAVAAVSRDEQLRLLVVDAVAKRFGAEAAEHDAVDGANPGAGEHRNRQLRDERHVERDAVALAHAERLQHVRKRRNFAIEIVVGQRSTIAGLAFPDDRRLVAASAPNVPVDAVDRDVQLSADEPFRVRRLPVEDLVPRPRPFELAGELGPEAFRIAFGLGVDRFVAGVRLRRECRRRLESTVFFEEIGVFGDILLGHEAEAYRTVSQIPEWSSGTARGPQDRGIRPPRTSEMRGNG